MRSFVFNDAKVSDHYAIIPTGTRIDRSSLPHDESVVYDMVVRRFLAQFFPEALLMLTRIETLVEGETFGSDGRVVKQAGWLEVAQRDAESRELPDITADQTVQTNKIEAERKLTKAPARYTDASIIAAMETAGKLVDDEELAEAMKERGLGTPATRAEIIEKLVRTGVTERRARNIVATHRGIDLIDLLERIRLSDLIAPDLTGEWEMSLRRIERGMLGDAEFMRRIEAFARELVDKIKGYEAPTQIGVESAEPVGACPLCGAQVIERPSSYACERHGRKKTDCTFSIPKTILRRPISRAEVLQLMEHRETVLLDGFVSRRGFKFSAQLRLKPDGKLEWQFANESNGETSTETVMNDEPLGRCPVCASPVVETTERYRCSSPDCRFAMKKTYANKAIDRTVARTLLETGRTELIEDFISKYNRAFSAYLKLGEGGKVEFEFLNQHPRSSRGMSGRRTYRTTTGSNPKPETVRAPSEHRKDKAGIKPSKTKSESGRKKAGTTPARRASRVSRNKGGAT